MQGEKNTLKKSVAPNTSYFKTKIQPFSLQTLWIPSFGGGVSGHFIVLYLFLTCSRCSNQDSLTFCSWVLLSLLTTPKNLVWCLTASTIQSSKGWLQELLNFLLHPLENGLLDDFSLENFLLLVNPYKVSSIFWPTWIPIIAILHLSHPVIHEIHPNEHNFLFKFLKLIWNLKLLRHRVTKCFAVQCHFVST